MLLNKLYGAWSLEREIEKIGKFSGTAEFAPALNGLAYEEKGHISFAEGNKYFAWQKLFYEQGKNGNEIIIWKQTSEGRSCLLHELNFTISNGNYIAAHTHLCGKDSYKVIFEIMADQLKMDYQIHGPRKDHRIRSILKKIK